MDPMIADGWYYVEVYGDPPWSIVRVRNNLVYWPNRTLPDRLTESVAARILGRVPDPLPNEDPA